MVAVKLDEDLPSDAAELLRREGHDAKTVSDEGLGGTKDPALWSLVQSEGRFFVTADKGFGDVRVYPPGSHAGILLLRPYRDGIGPLLELLRLVLKERRLEDLVRSLTVATPSRIRIRKR